ncbi:ATP-binding response regulator [Jannaschia donghaensis]|uniref:histidine kinase n=1 Tax=Jannaschia donghaensis TaxID=420998 RepID=A0A0M6YGQ1_9RHOB|nr:ATP-binding protein [Jannaschia donghaensis]CTQ49532.1 Signal transduction histidine-protein kinase BarA [Jannaschia donghaensis]
MDGSVPDTRYLEERRRRLAAERRLDHSQRELARAHSALVANADRLSHRYLAQREQNLKLSARQDAVLKQRKEAADQADRARRRLWHALEAMRDGFAVFDGQGHLVAANHVYLDLFDAASELAPGCHATEIFGLAAEEGAFDIGDLSPEEWAAEQVARWDLDVVPPLLLHHYDGRVVRFQDRRGPDGDVVSLALDVTEQRDREIALSTARDEAEQMARAKTEFLARMSHEIRTPMNGVIGLSQMLVEQSDDPEMTLYARTIRDSAEALLLIVNDTLDVSRLEAGKVDLRLAPMDMEALLIDCIRLAAATRHPNVQVGLSYPLDARTRFIGDEGRIRQIAMNLLGNALKFTEKGHVILRVSLTDAGLDRTVAIMTVEDTGPGIPAAKAESIFEAFSQVDDPSKPTREGTGLGLTISRGLAERMGGTLVLKQEQRASGGATFELTLPLAQDGAAPIRPALPPQVTVPEGLGPRGDLAAERLVAAGTRVVRTVSSDAAVVIVPLTLPPDAQPGLLNAIGPDARVILLGRREEACPALLVRAAAVLPVPVAGSDLIAALAPPPVSKASPPQPRLLVADDNATNRFLVDRILRDQPFAVTMVDDGAQAVAAFADAPPDAVILDISMPNVDGFEAAAAIRRIEAERGLRPVPLLALTAHLGDEMAPRLKNAGFAAFLTKPLRKDVLLMALAEALT